MSLGVTITGWDKNAVVGQPLHVEVTNTGVAVDLAVWLEDLTHTHVADAHVSDASGFTENRGVDILLTPTKAGVFYLKAQVTDASGATAPTGVMRKVTVVDTTIPLSIVCPTVAPVTSPDGKSVPVAYTPAAPVGGVPPYQVSYDHSSGSGFPVGTTTVHVSVIDAASHTATCSFSVVVSPPVIVGALLQPSDFTYIGSFQVAGSLPGGGDLGIVRGITLRSVGGQLHIMGLTGDSQELWEAVVPTPNRDTFPVVAPIKSYGDVTQNIWPNPGVPADPNFNPGDSYVLEGLHWDEPDQRVYWCFTVGYHSGGNLCSLGYSTIDAAGALHAQKVFSFQSCNFKSVDGFLTPIPSSFRALVGGKRLAIGAHFQPSVASSNDESFGSSLVAFDPPAATQATRSALPGTPLVGFWPFADPPPDSKVGNRQNKPLLAADTTSLDGWPVTKFGWQDFAGFGVWIETPSGKHGFLSAPTYQGGLTGYIHATVGHFFVPYFALWNPDDFAKVVQGTINRWDVQPVQQWPAAYPILPNDWPWADYKRPVTTIASNGGHNPLTVHCPGHGIGSHGNLVNLNYLYLEGNTNPSMNGVAGNIVVTGPDDFTCEMESSVYSPTTGSGGVMAPMLDMYGGNWALPAGMAYDPASNRVLVAWGGSGQMTVMVYQVAP